MKRKIVVSLLCFLTCLACDTPVLPNEEEEKKPDISQTDSLTIVHDGTEASPYSIAEAQVVRSANLVWVRGYIVGCVNGTNYSKCSFDSLNVKASNILLADTFPVTDGNRCVPVELDSRDSIRSGLNLYNNPKNYHQALAVHGLLTPYFNVPGIKDIDGYHFGNYPAGETEKPIDPNAPEEKEEPDDPNPPTEENDGNSINKPLSIAQAVLLEKEAELGLNCQSIGFKYISGIIIGYCTKGGTPKFETDEAVDNNVLLADSIGTTDPDKILVVKFEKDGQLRQRVSLKNHPENYNEKKLVVQGNLIKLYKHWGCDVSVDGGVINKSFYLTDLAK